MSREKCTNKIDNRGISLVELTVIMAIIVILTAVVSIGLNASSTKPALKCAQKISYSLQKARTSSVGKVDYTFTLRVDAGNAVVSSVTEQVKPADPPRGPFDTTMASDVAVSYSADGGASYVDLPAGSAMTFKFDRSSGRISSVEVGGAGINLTNIRTTRNGKSYVLTIHMLTGKVDGPEAQ